MKTNMKLFGGGVIALFKRWINIPFSKLPVPDFNNQYDETIL